MPISSKTLDTSMLICVILVGIEGERADACASAIRPIEALRAKTVADALIAIPRRRPLVVVAPSSMPDAEQEKLRDVAYACGSELLELDDGAAPSDLGKRLMEALRTAERRRIAR